MRLLWVGLICVSVSWLYSLPTFTPTNNFYLTFWILCSIIVNTIALRRVIFRNTPLTSILLAFPLVLFSVVVAFPYNLGTLLLLASLAAGFFCNRWKRLSSVCAGCFLTGFILIIQSVCISSYYIFAARYHQVNALNLLAHKITTLLGLKASLSDGIIYLPTYEDLLAFPAAWERLGIYFLLHFFIGGIILFLLFSRRWKQLLGFLGLCLGYALLRYIFLIFVFAQVNNAVIFWRPLFLTFSFAPLAFILSAIYPLRISQESWYVSLPSLDFKKRELEPIRKPDGRLNLLRKSPLIPLFQRGKGGKPEQVRASDGFSDRRLIFASLIFVGVFCLIGVWGFQDPGVRKSGKILIDEKHSDWEWTTKKLDTEWYGSQSVYNYYSLAEYLNYFYHVDRNIDQKLSKELLADYDVLLLKTPTESFDEQEIEEIVQFVRQGGGVWLIGDHTNVFGVDYYLNFIAERFGLRFRYDSTYDLASGGLSLYRRPKVFPHPIVQNMPPFLFATSCSLEASPFAENVIIGYGLRSRMLAYSETGFFPERLPTHDYKFGLFLQAAAVKYGKGRVATFTDSTCFSNFYMFIPGKPELVLGYVEWLNRKNRYAFLTPLFGVIAIAALAVGIYIGWKAKSLSIFFIMFSSALCASAFSVATFKALAQVAYRLPKAHTDFWEVCFESEHSNIVLPVLRLVDKYPNNYHTFYVWTQRLGYVPSFEQTLEDALMKGNLVVVINPTKPFTDDEIEKVIRYVEGGGSFLLLDGPQNGKSTSNQLLKPFQMQLRFSNLPASQPRQADPSAKAQVEVKQSVIYNNRYEMLSPAKQAGVVIGGQAILMTDNKQPVFSIAKRGKGIMAVMADSYIFTDAQMGGTHVTPNQEQQKIYELEFFMLERLVERKEEFDKEILGASPDN